MMILKQININGKTIRPQQVVNNKCYYFKNGKEIRFEYRLEKLPERYVESEEFHVQKNSVEINQEAGIMYMDSEYYSVEGEVLKIK